MCTQQQGSSHEGWRQWCCPRGGYKSCPLSTHKRQQQHRHHNHCPILLLSMWFQHLVSLCVSWTILANRMCDVSASVKQPIDLRRAKDSFSDYTPRRKIIGQTDKIVTAKIVNHAFHVFPPKNTKHFQLQHSEYSISIVINPLEWHYIVNARLSTARALVVPCLCRRPMPLS